MAAQTLNNPFLFLATLVAFVIHAGALYVPATQLILRVEPIGIDIWFRMAAVAASIIVAIEIHELVRRRRPHDPVALRPDEPAVKGRSAA